MRPLLRPSPSQHAKEHKDTVKVGNDGRKYKSTPDVNGVYRWRAVNKQSSAKPRQQPQPVRVPSGSVVRVPSGSVVHARLMVVLDDRLGVTSESVRGISAPTKVPPAARALLRRRIARNEFGFEFISVHGVSLRVKMAKTWFGLGRKATRGYSPVTKFAHKLVEQKSGFWAVDLTWHVAADPEALDMAAFRVELEGQISDGWGEGVEQFRFGPLVVCGDGDGAGACRLAVGARERASLSTDLDGQYAFNLTTVGAGVVLPRVLPRARRQ